MALTEQDESDLLGLVSGFGTAEADARGRQLAETRPEAARFLQQMQGLAKALELEPAAGPEEALSEAEADRMTDAVYKRWRRRRLGRFLSPLGVAAAILVVAVGLKSFVGKTKPRFGDVTLMRYGEFLDAGGRVQSGKAPLQRGKPFSTGLDKLARITGSDGTVLLMPPETTIELSSDEKEVTLSHGSLFVQTPTTLSVRVDDTEASLQQAEVLVSRTGDVLFWSVFKGSASILADKQSQIIVAGQRAAWNRNAHTLQTSVAERVLPNWIRQGLPGTPAP